MTEWLLVGVGLVLTLGTGVFVASEFALVNLDRSELEDRDRAGEKGLGHTIRALRITSTHLSSAQLGITLTTLLTGFTFEPAVSSLLGSPLRSIGLPGSAVPAVGGVVGLVIATIFSMLFGELVPKNFALATPLHTAKVVVPLQAAFTRMFRPLVSALNNSANGLLRKVGVEPKEELSGARTAEELSSLVRRSAAHGALEEDHARLLGRALRFAGRSAHEVMTPRVRMVTVGPHTTAATVTDLAGRTGLSRFPVIGRDADEVVGVVHVKHAFAVPVDRWTHVTAEELMVEPDRLPESVSVGTLLEVLRSGGFQMAIVIDEYGGTAGLVTMEDVVEELVGEVRDEHDKSVVSVQRQGDSLAFDAVLRPDELAELAGVQVPEGDAYESVGGFVIERLGRIPQLGDRVEFDDGSLQVERLDGMRIDRIRFIPKSSPKTLAPDDVAVTPDDVAGRGETDGTA
ncbi:hemolysin family protein [Flexivirga sp. B27]